MIDGWCERQLVCEAYWHTTGHNICQYERHMTFMPSKMAAMRDGRYERYHCTYNILPRPQLKNTTGPTTPGLLMRGPTQTGRVTKQFSKFLLTCLHTCPGAASESLSLPRKKDGLPNMLPHQKDVGSKSLHFLNFFT